MLRSLEAAKNKPSVYYKDTYHMEGDLHVIGTFLSPQDNRKFFSTPDWDPEEDGVDYRKIDRQSLESSIEKYSRDLAQEQQILGASLTRTATDEFNLACVRDESQQPQILQRVHSDELTRYLDNNKVPNSQPRTWWKYHQDEFPGMARLARDVLSIPASGACVGRLFNSARDICHYRRGSLRHLIISDLMMYMCTSWFEIHEEERIMLSEYLSVQEIQAANEERAQQQSSVYPISDNEEDESPSTELRATSQGLSASQVPTENALGKRRLCSIARDIEGDQEDDSEIALLPEILHRVSGRARTRSRLLDGYKPSIYS
ncbi:hypothetical protein N7481_013389 [Penicillium waksmanii]|uniref:uncharacterized protein n=1 Tax=Penicillium waksmanii TaxID=69791 RepID=UPI002549A78A|nr:uncharacterized protein N7481_013389 [Penicillium waksmanii]KAJ5963084.1 hypothetical protein N7481_013389 [Penicillium waksmanii]